MEMRICGCTGFGEERLIIAQPYNRCVSNVRFLSRPLGEDVDGRRVRLPLMIDMKFMNVPDFCRTGIFARYICKNIIYDVVGD